MVHSRWRVHKHYNPPPISSIVRHANELWFSPNFPRLCWLSARLQTCQLPHFWRDCPTFWHCKNKKKRVSPTSLKYQWWQILLYEITQNNVNFTWIFYFSLFTSLFSLFSYEKPSLNPKSPEPQLCGLYWFLVMYMRTVLAQCPTFLLW